MANTKGYLWITGLVVASLLSSGMKRAPRLDAPEIISRSVVAMKHDWDADPQYDCKERDRTSQGSKTYEDLMIDGSPYQSLIAVDEKPLSADQQASEKQKMQDAIAKRKAESPQDRAQRIAKYDEQRRRDHALIQDLTKAFDFKLAGEGRLDGHKVYVLDARPRPGYQPDSKQTQVLTGMKGKLWIDTATFQWVKVEAEVIHPVSIDGFVARVEPGTRFELEKTPVAKDVWLPRHFSMRSHAKVFFVFGKSSSDDETYFDYHPQKQ
ncbi:MAG TPA: hypothetical protein VHX36_09770 [Candidatus Acidoferrales bacterium]|jgi:hypothetical protein|nr:hypothetical protein [Candidatus Acidoferrales bacterium]